MSATEAAAWWGAVIATLVLAWDVFKWLESGAKISLTASANMKFHPAVSKYEEGFFVVVEATNLGDKKTTITHLFGMRYKSILHKIFRRKPADQFIVGTPFGRQPLPFPLDTGDRWIGAFIQDEGMEKMLKEGVFYVGVHHASSSKPVLVRMKRLNAQPPREED